MSKQFQEQKLKSIEKAARIDQEMMVGNRSFFSQLSLLAQRQMMDYYFVQPPLWKILARSKI